MNLYMNKRIILWLGIYFWSLSLIARPLKVLFIVGHFPSPSQTFVLNQMTGLIDRGHEVSIFSFHRDYPKHVHPDIEKYKLLDRVMYRKLPSVLPDCDIVFCQFGYHGKRIFEMPAIARWLKNKKVVTCLRGSDITTRFVRKPYKYAKLFRMGDLFLPVCDYFKQLLVSCGCPEEKIVVHHSAIDCKKFFFKNRMMPKRGPVRLISVCRLVEKKGIKYAINAIAQVIQRYPNVMYYIVGDGPEYNYLRKLIDQLHMQKKIILCGWKSQAEVIEILNQSHVFLLPSVTASDGNEEGIPNALKEAMAMGLPVIATWHAGNPELIENGVSGFLVSQRSAIEIAEKIMYLLEHPHEWATIGIAARQTVEEKFETKKTTERLEKLFYQLLDESR
jgi:colanic acid/amylovoran biosynthesis glycosyltransferase